MRLLSALLDTVLLPVKVAEDVLTLLPRMAMDPSVKSATRKQVEKIEDDLARRPGWHETKDGGFQW